jgi:preprotein translocase subunit SecG
MSIVIWLLTFFLVIDCLFLILLVLIQLPKKEAGMGQAFGGAATDALFGAGSGSALTKVTKYTAGIFFALTLLVSVLHGHQARGKLSDPRAELTAAEKAALTPLPKAPAATNQLAVTATNAVANATTNAIKLLNTNAPAATTK